MSKFGEWVDVNVELPEPGVPVLIWAGYEYGDGMGCFHASHDPSDRYYPWDGETSGGYECEDRFDALNVTHWMPLPEGPNV